MSMARGGEPDYEIEFKQQNRGRGTPLRYYGEVKPGDNGDNDRWVVKTKEEDYDQENTDTKIEGESKYERDCRSQSGIGRKLEVERQEEVTTEETMLGMIQQLQERMDKMTEKAAKEKRVNHLSLITVDLC